MVPRNEMVNKHESSQADKFMPSDEFKQFDSGPSVTLGTSQAQFL